MNGPHKVIGIRAHDLPAAGAAAGEIDLNPFLPPEGIDPKPWWVGVAPYAAVLLAIAWIAGMIWLARDEIARLGPIGLVEFIAALCAVPALIGIVWLVAGRSAVSARLFAGAREMRIEADALARTVAGLSMSVENNRDVLAGHVEALTAIGDNATARLAAIGRGLSDEIDQAGIHARVLDEAVARAESRMSALLALTPRAQAESEALGRSLERVGSGADTLTALTERAGIAEQAIKRVDEGARRVETLTASLASLAGNAEALTQALRAGDSVAAGAITTTEALLGALDAAAREIDETLPGALARLDGRLDETRRLIGVTSPELLALVTASESTKDTIQAVAAAIADQHRGAEAVATTLNDGLVAGHEKVAGVDRTIDTAITRVDRFVEDAAPRLLEALLRVRETAAVAADRAREAIAAVIPEAADTLEKESAAAMRRAAGAGVQAQIASVAEVADAAVGATSRAADRLEQQLARIAEATALVDTRLEENRANSEASGRDGFARRASLLIESMNSASIDLTRSLSPEVGDAAWEAYLKGDHGVFTRRAVRLLGDTEQRDILRLYDDDAGFRDQMNRYIRDFEAMLRVILAQSDGTALGVTLLSSDLGKLYVAMAQAIERLR